MYVAGAHRLSFLGRRNLLLSPPQFCRAAYFLHKRRPLSHGRRRCNVDAARIVTGGVNVTPTPPQLDSGGVALRLTYVDAAFVRIFGRRVRNATPPQANEGDVALRNAAALWHGRRRADVDTIRSGLGGVLVTLTPPERSRAASWLR